MELVNGAFDKVKYYNCSKGRKKIFLLDKRDILPEIFIA